MVGAASIPQWFEILLGEKFFTPCIVHECTKKNEKNIFCLDCCATICAHCLPPHRPHSLLQIRRYVYHDVMRLGDAQKLLDCSHIQSYTINSAKVVFLKERTLSRHFRASGNFCNKCDRNLQHPFLFCSLSCKVRHLVTLKRGTSKEQKLFYNCGFLQLPNRAETKSFSELADDQITSVSVLDSPVFMASGSTTSASENVCTTPMTLNKKKQKRGNVVSLLPSPEADIAAVTNRRKSAPQRSPLY